MFEPYPGVLIYFAPLREILHKHFTYVTQLLVFFYHRLSSIVLRTSNRKMFFILYKTLSLWQCYSNRKGQLTD